MGHSPGCHHLFHFHYSNHCCVYTGKCGVQRLQQIRYLSIWWLKLLELFAALAWWYLRFSVLCSWNHLQLFTPFTYIIKQKKICIFNCVRNGSHASSMTICSPDFVKLSFVSKVCVFAFVFKTESFKVNKPSKSYKQFQIVVFYILAWFSTFPQIMMFWHFQCINLKEISSERTSHLQSGNRWTGCTGSLFWLWKYALTGTDKASLSEWKWWVNILWV